MKLTARQREILDYIHQCVDIEGMPPTRAEIVEHFGFASPNAAQCHLRALATHGAIELRPGTARGIVPVRSPTDSRAERPTRTLPLIGRVAAGSPILAIENREDEISVDAGLFHPRPDYALRVHGDSMTGAGIEDGDLLMVHRTPEAASGQIVVARINDEVTVKRFRRRGRGIYLEAENPRHPTIHVARGDDFAIEGLSVGIVRPRLD
ncbi:MAG: transcriptional repressor LexA [Wenzhouxiangella sp.]